MQETSVQFLGWEDPLEQETATHSSFLAWRIPWKESDMTERLSLSKFYMRQLDSITDSMDMNLSKLWEMVKEREAWWAAIHGWQRVRHDSATEQQQQKFLRTEFCKAPRLLIFFLCFTLKLLLFFFCFISLWLYHLTSFPVSIFVFFNLSFLKIIS